jgi:hypothetical protein
MNRSAIKSKYRILELKMHMPKVQNCQSVESLSKECMQKGQNAKAQNYIKENTMEA